MASGKVRVAWTIFKLKVVRKILAGLMRLHLWHELRRRGTGGTGPLEGESPLDGNLEPLSTGGDPVKDTKEKE
jgi:hypothetical protein